MHNDGNQSVNRTRALARAALVVALAVASGGCFEYEQVVTVRADGSGSIREMTVIKGPMAAMMRSMDVQEESGDGSIEVTTGMDEEQKARDRAAELGERVRFVSFEKISEGDREGGVAVYDFDDVTALNLGAAPGMEDSGMGMGEDPVEDGTVEADADDDSEGIGFRFERDGRRRVLVAAFEFEEGEAAESEGTDEMADEKADETQGEDPMAEAAEGMFEMMQPMLAGMRMRTVVEVEGEVLEADAPIEDGSRVVLLDIDFDTLMADEAGLEKLKGLDDDASMGEFREAMVGLPGVVFPATDEIRIVFK